MMFPILCILLNTRIVISQQKEKVDCLVRNHLYHEDTGSCYKPLEQGPCGKGEWLSLDSPYTGCMGNFILTLYHYIISTGKGVCQPELSCISGKEPFLSPDGGAFCDCEEGKEMYKGKCEALFTVHSCNKGEVLVPEDFMRERNCPNQFSCKDPDKCQGFIDAKEELEKDQGKSHNESRQFLQELLCKRNSRRICCPDFDNESLLTPLTIIKSLNESKTVKCLRNPCLDGSWPWIGDDGVSVCKKAESHISTCVHGIEEDEGGSLTCKTHSEIQLFSLTTRKQNCGRRRSWRYGRCVRVFRGR